MRISDWSSDVCSSDLARAIAQADHERAARLAPDDIGIGLALLLEDILDQARKTLRALAEHDLRGADEIVLLVGGAGVDAGRGGSGIGRGRTRRGLLGNDSDLFVKPEERSVGNEWFSACRSWGSR